MIRRIFIHQQQHHHQHHQQFKYYYSTLRVGINGGSIAGLTTALTIKNTPALQKITVTVTDGGKRNMEESIPSQPVILSAVALEMYEKKFGIGKEIARNGHVIQEHIVRNFKRDTDFARVKFDPCVTIGKTILLNILQNALTSNSSSAANQVIMNRNEQMRHLNRTDQGLFQYTQFSNFGKKHFDVLVGAEDSPDSLVRETFFNEMIEREERSSSSSSTTHFGQEQFSAVIRCPAQLDPANKIVEWWGPNARLGCYMINNTDLFIYGATKSLELGRQIQGVTVLRQLATIFKRFESQGTEIILSELERLQDIYLQSNKRSIPATSVPLSASHSNQLCASTYTKRGYRLKRPTDGKHAVLIGDAAYALDNSLNMDATVHALTGHELGSQLCKISSHSQIQQQLDHYVAKSQVLIKQFEQENTRFSKYYLTSLPVFIRNLRLLLFKVAKVGPMSAMKNVHRFSN